MHTARTESPGHRAAIGCPHTVFDVAPACVLDVGDRVELIPSYCPTTINLQDVYYIMQEGVVIGVWPLARGAGRGRVA